MPGLPVAAERAHRQSARTGVLLLNLGTPAAPTPAAIRRYLAEFLGDPRVVELPRAVWLPILYGLVLPLRPRRLAHAYASIWRDDGSPLLAISRRQAQGLQAELSRRRGGEIPVALAMTYGAPGIGPALAGLQQRAVRRLLLLPAFPQYSGSTTGAAIDAVFAALRGRRWLPELRTVGSYHDHSAYIAALADSLRRHWQAHGRGRHLLMSFHGIPQRYVLAGDPYYCQCQKTARLLAQALQLPAGAWSVAFQSRFGRAPWVQPYTDAAIPALAAAGADPLDVICPGFAADCLETLEEVALRYRAAFAAAGGREFRYVPALNDDAGHLKALAAIAGDAIAGWFPTDEDADARARRAGELAPQFFGH